MISVRSQPELGRKYVLITNAIHLHSHRTLAQACEPKVTATGSVGASAKIGHVTRDDPKTVTLGLPVTGSQRFQNSMFPPTALLIKSSDLRLGVGLPKTSYCDLLNFIVKTERQLPSGLPMVCPGFS